MGKLTILALAAVAAAAPVGAVAGPSCRCRADGQFFDLGKLACITTSAGMKLARCEMALNNTSWAVLEDNCPIARATPLPTAPKMLAAYAQDRADLSNRRPGRSGSPQ